MKYEVSNGTLAIVPNEEKSSLVYEDDERFIVEQSPFRIMENSCEYFGSTYEGRKKGTTKLTGITHKVPIIIEESNSIIFFPTKSSRLKDCLWLSLNNLRASRLDAVLRTRKLKK